jgi:hypothetical protein
MPRRNTWGLRTKVGSKMISGMANGSLTQVSQRTHSDKNDQYVLRFLAKESLCGGELEVDEQSWIFPFRISNKTEVQVAIANFQQRAGLPVMAANWQNRRSPIRSHSRSNVISVVVNSTRANSATSSIYMIGLGCGPIRRFFSSATTAIT